MQVIYKQNPQQVSNMKELLLKHIVEIIFCCITGVFTFYLQKLKYELQQYKYIQSSLKAILKDRIFVINKTNIDKNINKRLIFIIIDLNIT